MLVAVMAVTVTVGMAVSVDMTAGFCRTRSRAWRAVVAVVAVRVVMRVGVHSRYRPFYARCGRLANGGCLLSGYLDTSRLRFR